jgi:hypothetical protein
MLSLTIKPIMLSVIMLNVVMLSLVAPIQLSLTFEGNAMSLP